MSDNPLDDLPDPESSSNPLDSLPEPSGAVADPNTVVGRTIHHAVSGLVQPIIGGFRSIGDVLSGKSIAETDTNYQKYLKEHIYQPPDAQSQALSQRYDTAAGSGYNPVNWPGIVIGGATNALSKGINAVTDSTVAGPVAAGALEFGLGAYGASKTLSKGTPTSITAAESAAPMAEGAVDTTAPEAVSGDAAQRAAVLKRVGITETRASALTGDAQAAADDYQMSGLNSPSGKRMAEVIRSERDALENHSDDLISRTGGTHGTDQSTNITRGETILSPLEGLQEHFDNGVRALYKQADERAAGQPVTLGGLKEVMGDDSLMTNSDRVSMRGALGAYLKKLNVQGEDGSIAGNVQQAETIRKYLNENWSPQNSGYVRALKNALDDDVTKSAGSDIYQQARQLRAQRAQTLEDPNGIAKILDTSGPNGINRKVYPQDVGKTLANMPVPQFQHIVSTLKNLPPELQEQGGAAINEIRAQFANQVRDAGTSTKSMWNSKGVDQVLKANNARMNAVFSPQELQGFQDLSAAGRILAKDQSYRGAFVQGHNLSSIGALAVRGSGAVLGETAGSLLGAPGVGTAVGSAAGEAAVRGISNRAAMKTAEARIRQIQ